MGRIACTLASIFWSCGESSHSQEDIDYAMQELEENKYRLTEVIAAQMKKTQKTQSLLTDTKKNNSVI